MSQLSGIKKPIREYKYNVFNRVTGQCEGVVWAKDSGQACIDMAECNNVSWFIYFAEKTEFYKDRPVFD